MDYSDLTDEQKAKARACKTPEELAALARQGGIELTDDELEAVAGGRSWNSPIGSCREACKGNCRLLEMQ